MSGCGCGKPGSVSNVLEEITSSADVATLTDEELLALLEDEDSCYDPCVSCTGAIDYGFEIVGTSWVRPGTGVVAPIPVCFPCRFTAGTYVLLIDELGNKGVYEIVAVLVDTITLREYGGSNWITGGSVFTSPRIIPMPLPPTIVTSSDDSLTVSQSGDEVDIVVP